MALIAGLLAIAASALAEQAPARWDEGDARDLLAFAQTLPERGLDPGLYALDALSLAIDAGDADAVDAAATALFGAIAHDLADGAVPATARGRWRIERPSTPAEAIAAAMDAALATDSVSQTLAGFEPAHAEYHALKDALRAATDARERETLAINLERWRWMPRDLGADYVLVNIPAYELIVVRGGTMIARRRVIVGAKKTPTIPFAAMVTGVAFNPTWFVPESIVAESVGAMLARRPKQAERLGYYRAPDGGVRQRPGPDNALGRMKLLMPNPYSVFLHDTPQQDAFARDTRALSHGCVRVENALDFAGDILGADWSGETIDAIVSTNETVSAELPAPMPVYVAYFTAATDAGGAVVIRRDIYGSDQELAAAAGSPGAKLSDGATCLAG